MTNAEVNRIIAESMGKEGFSPDRPQYNPHGGEVFATMRGEPKDFCGSLADIAKAIEDDARQNEHIHQWGVGWSDRRTGGRFDGFVAGYDHRSDTPAEALAHAYAQMLVAEKAKGGGNG